MIEKGVNHFPPLPSLQCGRYAARADGAPVSAGIWLAGGSVGGLTLEIYTVHGFVFQNHQVAHLAFPLNIVVFFTVTIFLSAAINVAAVQLRRVFKGGLRG